MAHNSNRPNFFFIFCIFALPALMSLQALSETSPVQTAQRSVAQEEYDEQFQNELQEGKILAAEIFQHEERERILSWQRTQLIDLVFRAEESQDKMTAKQIEQLSNSLRSLKTIYMASTNELDVFSMNEHEMRFKKEADRFKKLLPSNKTTARQ